MISGVPGRTGTAEPTRPASIRMATTTATHVMRDTRTGRGPCWPPPGRSALLVLGGCLHRSEERRARHPPHAHLDEHRTVHPDRFADEIADVGRLGRAHPD